MNNDLLRCSDFFCQHPRALGFGFLIVAILLILLMLGKAVTKTKPGKGGDGDRPNVSDFPPPDADAVVSVPWIEGSDPIDRRTEQAGHPNTLPARMAGSGQTIKEWDRILSYPNREQPVEIPAPQDIPISVPSWPVKVPRNKD